MKEINARMQIESEGSLLPEFDVYLALGNIACWIGDDDCDCFVARFRSVA